jgi:hypothetical protein
MKRRDVLKAGVVLASASQAVASAPDKGEDPRLEIQRLSNRISYLLDQIQDYERVVNHAKSIGPWAIFTEFTV